MPASALPTARADGPRPADADADDDAGAPDVADEPVFAVAAELFGLLATPVRLRIISALCRGDEKTVSQLQREVGTTQPNLSQHLGTLYRAGVLGRRSDASNRYYRIVNQQAALLCRTVCTQIAAELSQDAPTADAPAPRLAPRPRAERPRRTAVSRRAAP